MAGILDIRGGKIYSYDDRSGHYRPNSESMKWADEAFKNYPKHKNLREENKMNSKYDLKYNDILFGLDYFSDYSDDELEMREELSEKILNEVDKQSVFDGWVNYLKTNVKSSKAAWSFMAWFFNYGGHEIKVSNPYPFLGKLYYKLGLSFDNEPQTDDEKQMFDTFDSIYVEMLTQFGIIKQDDYFYVNLYNDDRLKKEYNAS